MRSTRQLGLVAVVIALVAVTAALSGCGGTGGTVVHQNIIDRTAWQSTGNRIAFAAPGTTGLLYVWTMDAAGGSMVLLNATQDTTNPSNEGGWHPAYSPDGTKLALAAQRGPTPCIQLMSSVTGDRGGITKVTSDAGSGLDEMPSWRPDALALVYGSTRRAGNYDIRAINADGTGQTDLVATAAQEKWPVYNPTNADQVAFQSDTAGTTDIWVLTISTGALVNLTAGNAFRDEAPAWSPDGQWIAFHSNRGGTFDIWKMHPDGTGLAQLTADAREDGFPVWKPDGTKLAFTRNYEVWTMNPDGTVQTRLTTRPT
jgi:Tol biopolymer transport system component